jgi:hypothetical protein
MTTTPYLSIVGWARNDGYTENYIRRIEHAVGVLARQLDRGGVDSEIILVEWNPPSDRPLLADVFASFGPTSHVTVRVIVVDRRFHVGWQGWQKRGMHGSNAANVGIRRARGKFVTPKALDTFYSEKLIEQIARRDLDEQAVYRCDRWDVRMIRDAWIDLPDGALLEELVRNVEQRHGRLPHSMDWKIRDLHTNACGDFTLMSARLWAEIRGYQRDQTVLCLDADSIALHAAAAHGAREVCWQDGRHVFKILHGMTHLQRTTTVWKEWQYRLDKYLVASKRRELAANLRIWLDYPRRRVRGVEEILASSIERNFVAKAARFARNDTSLVTNEVDWGLARETLPERILARAIWDAP